MSTRQKILNVSRKLFDERGINKTQMKDIALQSLINRRTLYRYFSTKEELLCVIQLDVLQELNKYLNKIALGVAGSSGLEKISDYLDKINVEDIKNIMAFTAQFDAQFNGEFPSVEIKEEFEKVGNPTNILLFDFINEGINDGSLRDDLSAIEIFEYFSHSFIAMYQRIVIHAIHKETMFGGTVDFVTVYKKIILNGIKKEN